MKRGSGLCTIAALAVLTSCGAVAGSPTANTVGATSASSAAADLSLPARWWIWSESIDPADNPIDDTTGAHCGDHQPADVWFLAGTHGGSATRRCMIPAGRPVYFPILDQACTLTAAGSAARALRECQGSADQASASLDGTPLTPAEATSGSAFPITGQPDSSNGFSPGLQQVVTWGIWVGPLDLSPGRHVLAFKGVAGGFETAVEYDLTVG